MRTMASFVSAVCYIPYTMKKGTVLDAQQALETFHALCSSRPGALTPSIHSKSLPVSAGHFSGHSRIATNGGKPALVPVS